MGLTDFCTIVKPLKLLNYKNYIKMDKIIELEILPWILDNPIEYNSMNLMKLSFNRKFLIAVTLLSTTALGMESLQAATITPAQEAVTSTNVALKKKPGKKKIGKKKKPSSAVKKPEEVPVTPPEDVPNTPGGVTNETPPPPGQDVPKVPSDAPKAPGP
jgi:hypothetical protein